MSTEQTSAYIIGPSNNGIKNLWTYGKICKSEYKTYIHNIADIINEHISIVGCIPDLSVPFDIVKMIKNMPNKKVHINGFYPMIGDNKQLSEKKKFVDELILVKGGWSMMNTEISKNFDVAICCGLSAGVFTEISHTKVHRLWCNKITPIFIDERTISSHINAELEKDVYIFYFNSDKELIELIKKYKEGELYANV